MYPEFERNLGNNVDVNADVQANCSERDGFIYNRLKVIAGTITALALTACGDGVKAQAQEAGVKAPEVVQQVKMEVEKPEITLKAEAPEVLNCIDEGGNFSFQLCRDAGYDNKGCLKFKRQYSKMLIDAENDKQTATILSLAEQARDTLKALNN